MALEESTMKVHQQAALAEVKEEYGRYFETLQQHPRMLVNTEVPSLKSEGMERLRDTEDAKDWQDAVKHVLADEIQHRAQQKAESSSAEIQTLHSSIELFQQNPDMVPGTKQFDKELAASVMEVAKPYELRVDGKLYGFSIPLQPLVQQTRQRLMAQRAAAKAAPAAAPAAAAPSAPAATNAAAPAPAPAPPVEGPQAGIPSQAGQASDQGDDYSTLFGTLGLPHLRI